jgi:hypothetical protein
MNSLITTLTVTAVKFVDPKYQSCGCGTAGVDSGKKYCFLLYDICDFTLYVYSLSVLQIFIAHSLCIALYILFILPVLAGSS